MDNGPIQPIIQPVIINTMLNNNGMNNGHGLKTLCVNKAIGFIPCYQPQKTGYFHRKSKSMNTPSVKRQGKRQGKRQNLGMGLGPILERHNAFQWTLTLPLPLSVFIL